MNKSFPFSFLQFHILQISFYLKLYHVILKNVSQSMQDKCFYFLISSLYQATILRTSVIEQISDFRFLLVSHFLRSEKFKNHKIRGMFLYDLVCNECLVWVDGYCHTKNQTNFKTCTSTQKHTHTRKKEKNSESNPIEFQNST